MLALGQAREIIYMYTICEAVFVRQKMNKKHTRVS